MTVGTKMHSVLTSIESAKASLDSFALETEDKAAKQDFINLSQQLETTANTLKQRVNYIEQQEPGYKMQQQPQRIRISRTNLNNLAKNAIQKRWRFSLHIDKYRIISKLLFLTSSRFRNIIWTYLNNKRSFFGGKLTGNFKTQPKNGRLHNLKIAVNLFQQAKTLGNQVESLLHLIGKSHPVNA